jgi:hypothetical protein
MTFDPEELVKQYEKEIVMASYLYYNTGTESPLTDAEYDQRVNYVVMNWSFTSDSFRKRITKEELKTSGFSLKATKKEIKYAMKWAKND